MTDYTDILARLRSGDFTGIELFGVQMTDAILGRQRFYRTQADAQSDPEWDAIYSLCIRALHGSIDAALALVEKLRPGWEVMIAISDRGVAYLISRSKQTYAVAPTPALAILIALFEALSAGEEER